MQEVNLPVYITFFTQSTNYGIKRYAGFLLFLISAFHAGAQTPGGVTTNLTSWFKANTTVAGNILPDNNNNTAVAEWKSELGNYSVTQTTTSNKPLFRANNNTGFNFNFNFNPVLQFASSQVRGLKNTTSTTDLLGNTGTYFLVINTFRETGFTSSTCFSYTSPGTGARYQAKADFRIQTGVTAGMGYIGDLDPVTTGLNGAGIPAINYPRQSAIILTSRSAGAPFRVRRNADTTVLGSGSIYYPAISSGLGIGFSAPGNGEATSSAIAEVITFNADLTDANINKIESYLALKYGITLSQSTTFTLPVGPTNYTASTGSVFWNAAANTNYGKCITGIGRDDGSALLQKQSKSVQDSTLVYIYNGNTGGTFPEMNTDNTNTLTTDNSFLLFGDNGLSRNLTSCAFSGKMGRMARVWKVQQTGTIGNITLAVDQTDVSTGVKNLLVSTDPLFAQSATTVYPLQSANGKLYTTLSLSSNQYFSFASDSLTVQLTSVNPTCSSPTGGTITALVTGGIPGYSYSWNTTPVQTTSTATGLGGGTYTVTVTHNGSCPVSYPPIILTAPVAPVLSAAASPVTICSGSSSTLTATLVSGTVASYTWSPGGQTGSSITVSPATTTTYTVTGDDGFGCTGSATVAVTVNQKPTASFTVTPLNACIGTVQTVTYTGSGPATANYNWNFGGATVQSGTGAGPYTILYNTAGFYTIQLQVTENNCSSAVITQPVTVSASPAVSFSVSRSRICSGDTVTVNFNGTPNVTATPIWNWGGGVMQSGSNFGPYVVKYASTGTVTLTVNDGACSSTAPPQIVTVVTKPVAAFTPNVSAGCIPLEVQFTNSSANADLYQWTFGDGGISAAITPLHSYTSAGLYTVQLVATAQGLCYDTLKRSNLINVQIPPTAAFTSIPGLNTAVELHLANFAFTNTSQLATSYIWKFGDGISSSSTSPTHQFTLPGNYEVTLIAMNSIGCADTLSQKYYTVIPSKVLTIPNAFSPNGDGTNDIWQIDGLKSYPTCTVDIFNRWGQTVYSSTGYQHPWDGKYNGKPVPVATYYYVIKTLQQSYTGWVLLIK